MEISGGCHCRALTYQLVWPESAGKDALLKIPGRRCSCSFCMRIGGIWTSHPDASLTIVEDTEHPAAAYRFGTKTADFLFCRQCGITPLVTCEIDGQIYAVVNVNTFHDTPENAFEIDPGDTCFDGESTGARLDRRKGRWIGRVTLNQKRH